MEDHDSYKVTGGPLVMKHLDLVLRPILHEEETFTFGDYHLKQLAVRLWVSSVPREWR